MSQLMQSRRLQILIIGDDADSDCSDDDNGQSNNNDVVNEGNDTSTVSTRETPRSANAETMRKEQLSDLTLKGCWSLAERERGGFYLWQGLLHHHERILGQSFEQLVLPECRRAEVLKLAHDTFGAHMGRSTRNSVSGIPFIGRR